MHSAIEKQKQALDSASGRDIFVVMSPTERLAKAEQASKLLDELQTDIMGSDEDEHADNLCNDAVRAADKLATHLRHQAARSVVAGSM